MARDESQKQKNDFRFPVKAQLQILSHALSRVGTRQQSRIHALTWAKVLRVQTKVLLLKVLFQTGCTHKGKKVEISSGFRTGHRTQLQNVVSPTITHKGHNCGFQFSHSLMSFVELPNDTGTRLPRQLSSFHQLVFCTGGAHQMDFPDTPEENASMAREERQKFRGIYYIDLDDIDFKDTMKKNARKKLELPQNFQFVARRDPWHK